MARPWCWYRTLADDTARCSACGGGDEGKPLPLEMVAKRVWGLREKLFESLLSPLTLDALVRAASPATGWSRV